MRLFELDSKMAKGFTLVEVMVSIVIFTFVALIAIKASGSSDFLVEQSNKKKEMINLMSIVLLHELTTSKDKKEIVDFVNDLKLDDKIVNILKGKEVSYEKETIVAATEFLPSLIKVNVFDTGTKSFIYLYE